MKLQLLTISALCSPFLCNAATTIQMPPAPVIQEHKKNYEKQEQMRSSIDKK